MRVNVVGTAALALLGALAAVLGPAAHAQAQPAPPTPHRSVLTADLERVSLSGAWRFQLGDDPGYARATLDDAAWELIEVPGLWGARAPTPGFAWYRTVVDVPWLDGSPAAVASWHRQQPAVAIAAAGNAWELFAGGARIASFASMPPAVRLEYPSPRVAPIPVEAVSGGQLVLALRVWREPNLAAVDPAYSGISGVDGEVLIGRARELEDASARAHLQEQRGEIAFGPMLGVLLLAGLYHLQLFRRRRALREYLWLGSLLSILGVICTLHTWWWDAFSDDMGLRIKLSIAGGFVVGALFVQFLWPFLGKPITRGWRAYQMFQLTFGLVTLLSPGMWFLANSAAVRGASWLPWLLMSVVLVVREAWRNNPEGRTLLIGLGVFVLCALYATLQNVGLVPKGDLDSVMLWILAGVTAFMLSMVVSLSNRFVRVYNSLDGLNRDLEGKNRVLTSMNAASGRFVPTEFLKLLGRENLVQVERGDQVQKEMSVLFSDIRSFTSIIEGMTPQQNFAFINAYLAHMEPPIRAEGGFIDSYIGDAVMALFETGADAAVRAGIGDLRALESYNAERARSGEKPVRIGIGVSSGQLMLGTIGGKDRINCGVIGDCVNLAARVESMTKLYGAAFLISEDTFARLEHPSAYQTRVVDRVRAKGKSKPVTIHEVLDGLPSAARAARIATRPVFDEGWRAFQAKDVVGALAHFRAVVAQDADDQAARLWVARCEQLEVDGLPAGFDGVVELLTK